MKTVRIPSEGYGSNCWLIIDGEEYAIIDPSSDISVILSYIEKRGLKKENLKYVLLTHGHFDHIGAADDIRDVIPVPLCVHRDDADFLTDGMKNAYKYFFRVDMKMRPAEKLLSDGDVLHIGNTDVTVVHTPGHTPGSVCYMTEKELYSGDTLFDGSIGRTDLVGGSAAKIEESLKKIMSLQKNLELYPGHGSVSTLEKQSRFNPFLKGLI